MPDSLSSPTISSCRKLPLPAWLIPSVTDDLLATKEPKPALPLELPICDAYAALSSPTCDPSIALLLPFWLMAIVLPSPDWERFAELSSAQADADTNAMALAARSVEAKCLVEKSVFFLMILIIPNWSFEKRRCRAPFCRMSG